MSNYRELPPPADLARYLSCLWTRHTTADDESLEPRVLPDSCIDIVWIGGSPPVVVGPATAAVIPRLAPDTPIAGVRFRPGMAPCLLGLPASEIRDTEALLSDIWRSGTAQLVEQAGAHPSAGVMLAALVRELRWRLPNAGAEDGLVLEAVALVTRDPASRVGRISTELGLSERHLRRRFEASVGYGPKTLARVMRLQRTLRLARDGQQTCPDLATLAMMAGYAD